MRDFKVLFVVVLLLNSNCCKLSAEALEASWIGNDENEPLPQSAKYRANLRRICSLMRSGGKLPKSYAEKRPLLEKMCSKLQKDDDNVSSAVAISSAKNVALLLCGFTGAVVMFRSHFDWIVNIIRQHLGPRKSVRTAVRTRGGFTENSVSDGIVENVDAVALMRMARLQKFKSENGADGLQPNDS